MNSSKSDRAVCQARLRCIAMQQSQRFLVVIWFMAVLVHGVQGHWTLDMVWSTKLILGKVTANVFLPTVNQVLCWLLFSNICFSISGIWKPFLEQSFLEKHLWLLGSFASFLVNFTHLQKLKYCLFACKSIVVCFLPLLHNYHWDICVESNGGIEVSLGRHWLGHWEIPRSSWLSPCVWNLWR